MFCKFSAFEFPICHKSGFGWIAFSFAFLPCQAIGKTTTLVPWKETCKERGETRFTVSGVFKCFRKLSSLEGTATDFRLDFCWYCWFRLNILLSENMKCAGHRHIIVAFYDPWRILPLHSMIPCLVMLWQEAPASSVDAESYPFSRIHLNSCRRFSV